MATRLTKLKIGEVSLVDKAANKRKFLIMKSEGGDTMGDLVLKNVDEDLAKILKAIAEDKKFVDVLKFAEGNEAFLKAVMEGDVELMKSVLAGSEFATKVVKSILEGESKTEAEVAMDLLDSIEGDLSEETVAAITKMAGIKKKANITTIKKNDDGSFDLSDITEEIRPMVEELWKANETNAEAIKKANDRAEENEKILKAERDERLLKEFITKADGFKNLSVKSDVFGKILKKISAALSDDENKELDRVLKSADDNITNLFKEYGHNNDGDDDTSAIAQLEKAAGVIAARDGITKEVAFVKAMDENPELAKKELAERTH